MSAPTISVFWTAVLMKKGDISAFGLKHNKSEAYSFALHDNFICQVLRFYITSRTFAKLGSANNAFLLHRSLSSPSWKLARAGALSCWKLLARGKTPDHDTDIRWPFGDVAMPWCWSVTLIGCNLLIIEETCKLLLIYGVLRKVSDYGLWPWLVEVLCYSVPYSWRDHRLINSVKIWTNLNYNHVKNYEMKVLAEKYRAKLIICKVDANFLCNKLLWRIALQVTLFSLCWWVDEVCSW
jgi:hypothetical protein